MLHLLFEDSDSVQNALHIGIHFGPAQPDQRRFHQYLLLRCKSDPSRHIRENTDIPHQTVRIDHGALFLKLLQIFLRYVEHIFKIIV